MIGIIDYGMGNIGSVRNALSKLGEDSKLISTRKEMMSCHKVILPGVGAFDPAIEALIKMDLVEGIKSFVDQGQALLGICLGMQLCFSNSAEGKSQGLGLIRGEVKLFLPALELKIPHMGWNQIAKSNMPLVASGSTYYFVHSYYCQATEATLQKAQCDYGVTFDAAIQKDNLTLTQFHPEKSGEEGLAFLKKWLKIKI